jgi:hypothetical protein
MILLRLLLILAALTIVLSGGMYVFTRDARYKRFAWQVVRLVVYAVLVLAVLFVLERYALVGVRAIL